MTLLEMANYICGKVGQTDSASVTMCKSFLARRAQMIYDAFLWKDSQLTATVNTTASVSDIAMPAEMDRVIAIRAAGDFLQPVDSAFLIESDPTAFERTGTPLYYEEWTDPAASNAKKIRLLPTSSTVLSLRIIGKRTMPALSADGDSPILRNIDNCLIAFAQADMLQKLRQYAKSAQLIQEAGALLDEAKKVESEQSARPRRAKNITVSGNSLAEMVDAVCSRCGTWTLDYAIQAREFLRRNYQLLWDSELWPESLMAVNVNTDGEQIILPDYVDRVIAVRPTADAAYELAPADLNLYLRLYPGILDQVADALAYTTLAPVAVAVLPPTRERLVFVSTNAADKGRILVRGETAGLEKTETVTLNGTTPVNSVNSYDVPLTIAKGITTGDVSVTGLTSATLLETLLAAERERKHMRLWLQPSPGTAEVALIVAKRRITPLISDEDTPMLRNAANVLIASAAADLFDQLSKPKEAESARSRATAALKALKDGELRQNARQPRVVPSVEYPSYVGAYNDYSFLPKG